MVETLLPFHASVVVIGGGIMGCSTLYHLAEQGISDAVLIERHQLTSGTTWHSAAQVRALRSSRNLTELIRYSISLYARLEEETGQSTGWLNEGSLSIATTSDRLTHIRRQESLARVFGIRAQSIAVAEAKERWPLMNVSDVLGAVWSPDDGRVSPSDLCAALAKGARDRGARIFEGVEITGTLTRAGRMVGVETNKGTVTCDAVALCTGLWSRESATLGNAMVPVWPCEHFYLLTRPMTGIRGHLPTLSDHDHHLYIRDESGGLLVGCFEPMGKSIHPDDLGTDCAFRLLPEDWEHFEPMMRNALHRIPALEQAEVKTLLNGPEGFTPDGSFLLGETAETRGLFLGCGMNSVGVATGGGAGRALAHCIIYGHTPMDLHEVDPKRFPMGFHSVAFLSERVPEVLGKHYEIAYPGRQWTTGRNQRQLPLGDRWQRQGAHFGQIYGFERPLYFAKEAEPELTFGQPSWFSQVRQEVRQAHHHAALFDQSTLGKICVSGPKAESFLNRLCSNDMSFAPGGIAYALMLNEWAGIESDLVVMRLDEDQYRLYVGTSAVQRDLAWLRNHLGSDEEVTLADETEAYAVLALTGPDSAYIASQVGAVELNTLGYFRHCRTCIAGVEVRGARLSYVGEAGWEITCPSREAHIVYDALHAAGARPSGLFAQTSMRIEKRFLAYGPELNSDVNPIEAGLGWAVSWDSEFIGRVELARIGAQAPSKGIVSIVLDGMEVFPLGGEPVYSRGNPVGHTTSAAFGHRVDRFVALAMIDVLDEARWLDIEVDVAGHRVTGTATLQAAFDPGGIRMRGRT